MDTLDMELISWMEQHGFQDMRTLSESFSVNERTIRRRVHNMLTRDIIRIIAIPDFVSLGYKAWAKVCIKVKPGWLESVSNRLMEHPRVYFVAHAVGKFDIILAVLFKSEYGLIHFLNSELVKIKGFHSSAAHMLISPIKYYNFHWDSPVFKKCRETGEYYIENSNSPSSYRTDQLDNKILQILAINGRASAVKLKSETGAGETKIRRRLSNMSENGVFKRIVIPNPNILKYESWATIGIAISDQFRPKLIESLVANDSVYLCSHTIGQFNLIISVRFDRLDKLGVFIKTELATMAGISSIEPFLHVKPLKYHNIRWPALP